MRGRRSTTSICPDVEMGDGAKRRRTADAKWAYERARNALTAVTHWLDAAGAANKQSPRDVRRRLAELERWVC